MTNFFSLSDLLDKMSCVTCAVSDAVYFEENENERDDSSIVAAIGNDAIFDDVDSDFDLEATRQARQEQYRKDQRILTTTYSTLSTSTEDAVVASRRDGRGRINGDDESNSKKIGKNSSKMKHQKHQMFLPESPTDTYTTVSLSCEYDDDEDNDLDELVRVLNDTATATATVTNESTATTDITSNINERRQRQIQQDCFRERPPMEELKESNSDGTTATDRENDDPRLRYRCLMRMKPQNYVHKDFELSTSSFDKEDYINQQGRDDDDDDEDIRRIRTRTSSRHEYNDEDEYNYNDDSYLFNMGEFRYLSPVMSPVSSAIDNGEYDDHDDYAKHSQRIILSSIPTTSSSSSTTTTIIG